ncbi:hypothetical protein [Actinospica robiniae]|uniref:hypothetical protein n=1 Tax=Actinospica robiniae TaxID=304901 RepID=UPI00041A9AF3|nr:hypothetical protein [Actinospica robiniae]
MEDIDRTYTPGSVRTEDWYKGVIRPVVGLDPAGAQTLQGERQGNEIGVDFSQNLWGDSNPDHVGLQGSFGDNGTVDLVGADGTDYGASWFGPYNVWDIPSAGADYTLKLSQQRAWHTDVWQRSGTVETDFTFRSRLDGEAYSQSLPLLYPSYGIALDPSNNVTPGPQQITLAATGQQGYTPGTLTSASLSYSYDDGVDWLTAKVKQINGVWTAYVDHTGQSGKLVTLKVTLKSADGASVTQTVTDAYGVE